VQPSSGGPYDAFVTKLNASGTALVYSTYLGGNGYDEGDSIAVDPSGNACIGGLTESSNFPTTPGALHTTLQWVNEAFVTKLNSTGTAFVFSTYFWAAAWDVGAQIAVDVSGNVYVTGASWLPFVAKLNSTGTALVYNCPLGFNATAIALDSLGNAYVTGGFSVAKINSTGTALLYSTNITNTPAQLVHYSIALDSLGNAYVTGLTTSNPFPTTPGGRTITASYSGDGNFTTSTGMLTQTVGKASTSTVVSSSVNPSVYGQSVTFSVCVMAVPPGDGTPTGTVQFVIENTNYGQPVPLIAGCAVIPLIPPLPAGTDNVSVVYSGDSNFIGSTGSVTLSISKATPTVSVSDAGGTYSGNPYPA
jgi:hypothetical protein